ncbi:MAG: hypothetical protein P1V97_00080 [Planctomycetota bacterium]|nr:hypothetical protein [Planctomycetota bacterium]
MGKVVCLAAGMLVLLGTTAAYADIAPPPQENVLLGRSLLVGLPLLALIAGSYLWSRRSAS